MSVTVSEEWIVQQPPEVQQVLRALLEQIRLQSEQMDHLNQQINDLQSRLNTDSTNSSKPPSTTHPHAKPAPKKPKGKRKRGGQNGHARCVRPLIPTSQCDQVIPLKPTACRRCQHTLQGEDPNPLRHQVYEIPPIKPLVTEYQQHRLLCPCCNQTTCAPLPEGVASLQAGSRLVAFTATLMAHYRQSKRRTAAFLSSVFHVPASPGWVVKLQKVASQAVAVPYQELTKALPTEAVLGIDETPHKQGKHKSWLWTLVAASFTVFALRLSRAGDLLTDLLGPSFAGVVVCDRARMYLSQKRLQWCWAHLGRDFQKMADYPEERTKLLGKGLQRQRDKLFALWSRCRDGTLSRKKFVKRMKPIRQTVERLLLRGWYSPVKSVRGTCRELYRNRHRLWTFVENEGVEPTNNASERSLRHAVIWRKLSFGTQSKEGSIFVERMLTVIETCRQQKRDVLAYLTEAVERHFAHQTAPSLLPTS